MIYKFKFEVCNGDNEYLVGIGEESDKFWPAFTAFIKAVVQYAASRRIDV